MYTRTHIIDRRMRRRERTRRRSDSGAQAWTDLQHQWKRVIFISRYVVDDDVTYKDDDVTYKDDDVTYKDDDVTYKDDDVTYKVYPATRKRFSNAAKSATWACSVSA